MTTLVVGWDSDVDELSWGVSIAESDNWDVNVGSLLDSLGVGAGVGDDDEAGFLEGASDVVGEVTRGESTGDGDGTGVGGKLQDSTLAIGTGGNDTDIGGVVDSCDDAGSENDLLPAQENMLDPRFCLRITSQSPLLHVPGLANIDNVDSVRASLPQVGFHVNLQVLGSEVALSCEEHLNVLGGGIEDWGEVRRSHLCGLNLTVVDVKSLEDGC